MAVTKYFPGVDTVSPSKTAASFSGSIKSVAHFFISWVKSCRDYYAAAATYERLRKLSNAELRRRGLSRDTLAQDLVQSYDRTACS
jgi:hypothetical protein